MSDNRIKKPIRITANTMAKPSVDKLSDVGFTLNHALITLSNEIEKLRSKSFLTDVPLSQPEIKIITEAIKILLATEKHQNELKKSDEFNKKLSEMSEAELLEYAKLVIGSKTSQTTLDMQEKKNE